MSAAYASRFEAVFLCTHPKGPKMSYAAAGRYMKKSQKDTREKTRVMPFIGSCKWHNTLFRSRDRVIRIPERAYRVLILIRPQRGILIRMLFGINGGGGDTLSTAKYTNPKIQAEHRAVKRSPATVKADLETY
ncbi:hypothetical protein ALC60_04992 [Trachymyrmex zeteki]|uniref:Uncharacterized protein n=1 Tax=Mycetomoellerius zeteki TaxID=64791 RepID=A0A151X6Z9_9HYME|nr:hypothetical protein ALC60_04992 [Trachymyrmex zeteki]